VDCAFATGVNCKKFCFVLCSSLSGDFMNTMFLCVIFVSAYTSPVLVEICDALRSREMIVVGFLFLFFISPASSSSQLTTRALSWIVHLLPKRIARNSDLFCVLFLFGTFMNTLVSV
jgi:hypothetical protein